MIRRNILANALGGSCQAVLTLLIIPIQIRVLGVDAYGLLAFVASLQVLFSIFDLGLSPTIAREVAIDTSPDLRLSRELLQLLSAGYIGIGLVLGATVIVGAEWVVTHWVELGSFPADTARSFLQLSGLAVMLRWPVSFFSGVLTGRGRFDILNLLKASTAAFGILGGALIILMFSSLVYFAAWMALSALVEVTLYLIACFRLVPDLSLRPRLSSQALNRIWKYVRDLGLINFLGISLTQSDRLFLSALASIATLGYYSLAYNLLLGISLLQGFVTSALFPTFATLYERGATEKLVADYNRAAQFLVYIVAFPVSALIFFGEPFLVLWTTPESAVPAARILSILAPAVLLTAAMAIPYTLALATGHTSIVVRVFLIGLVIYLPLLALAIVHWGGVGAAAAFLLLNVAYVAAMLPLVQRHIVGQSWGQWLGRNVLPFVLLGTLSFGLARALVIVSDWHGNFATWAACGAATLIYAVAGLRSLDPVFRQEVWVLFQRFLMTPARSD